VTTSVPATSFTDPAPAGRLERAAAALTAKNFAVEILDDAAAARTRINGLIPEGASVFTGASEDGARTGPHRRDIPEWPGLRPAVPDREGHPP
jgi:hypothetical protein